MASWVRESGNGLSGSWFAYPCLTGNLHVSTEEADAVLLRIEPAQVVPPPRSLGGTMFYVRDASCCWTHTLALIALPLIALLGFQTQVAGAQDVTFAKDVAPILFDNCVSCHQEGGLGPMELVTYETAKQYAPLIKMKVLDRQMPPGWNIERTIGIQDFKNDPTLSNEDVETIARWVDAGAPLGDPADMPPAPEMDYSGTWALAKVLGRPPDLVLRSPPFTVVDNGQDQWAELTSRVEGLTEPRWARGVETRPANPDNRYVFHHWNTRLTTSEGRSLLSHSNVGKEYDLYPEDSGTLVEPGAEITFDMHFSPRGQETTVQGELALWFYPKGHEPEFASGERNFRAAPFGESPWRSGNPCWKQQQPAPESALCTELVENYGNNLFIPPDGVATLQGVHILDRPLRIHSIQIHMHQRGKSQTLEAIYPDGRREVLNRMNHDHRWMTTYVYEDHAQPLLPKGSVLLVTSQFDNTKENPNNPDPTQWVFYGRRTVDEMSHMWVGSTWLDEEQFERLVRERQQQVASR